MKNSLRKIAPGIILAFAAVAASPSDAAIFSGKQNQSDRSPGQAVQHPDYVKNHYFNQGNRDGFRDFKKKQRKERNHEFPNDVDRQAYEKGYQLGVQGKRSYRQDHPLSSWARVRTLQYL